MNKITHDGHTFEFGMNAITVDDFLYKNIEHKPNEYPDIQVNDDYEVKRFSKLNDALGLLDSLLKQVEALKVENGSMRDELDAARKRAHDFDNELQKPYQFAHLFFEFAKEVKGICDTHGDECMSSKISAVLEKHKQFMDIYENDYVKNILEKKKGNASV